LPYGATGPVTTAASGLVVVTTVISLSATVTAEAWPASSTAAIAVGEAPIAEYVYDELACYRHILKLWWLTTVTVESAIVTVTGAQLPTALVMAPLLPAAAPVTVATGLTVMYFVLVEVMRVVVVGSLSALPAIALLLAVSTAAAVGDTVTNWVYVN